MLGYPGEQSKNFARGSTEALNVGTKEDLASLLTIRFFQIQKR
jgi:hypothetical protein